MDGNGGFATGNVNPGATSAAVTMNTAGTFTYHCSIHPGMVGTLTVSKSRFAVEVTSSADSDRRDTRQ